MTNHILDAWFDRASLIQTVFYVHEELKCMCLVNILVLLIYFAINSSITIIRDKVDIPCIVYTLYESSIEIL